MKITAIDLYTVKSGETGERGASSGESQYWGGGWIVNSLIANPMSVHPEYADVRTSWMGPGQDPYVIEISTDGGISGFAANYGGGAFACAIIDQHFRRFLIRQDPMNIELIWDQMERATSPYGLGGTVGMAMSGVDLALWDLMGKALDQPVYKLLGGHTKDTVPCYVTATPQAAEHWPGRGFLGLKITAPWGVESGRDGVLKMADLIERVRGNMGESMELMIDCYMAWETEFTLRLAERVRDFDVEWFEDPLRNGYAAQNNRFLRGQLSPIMLATGNMEYHYRAFHEILRHEATDIIQPEIQWIGGMTAVRRVAAMAKPYDISVVPHCSGVYNYHFVMSNTNSPFAEFISVGDGTSVGPIFGALENEPLPVDGHVSLDQDLPGFGVDLNRDLLVEYDGQR